MKTSATTRRASARRSVLSALLSFSVTGCDIVQGFQNAGDTIFPEQATHLAAPPLRLVAGGYRNIDLAAGQRLHLLARAAGGGDSLFAMRYAEPHPCEIAGVGRYAPTRDPNRSEVILAYFHDDARQGTLHFADTSCQTFAFSVADARLPLIADTERAIIIWSGKQLLSVDPVAATSQVLADEVDDVIVRLFANRSLVRRAGRIEVFGADWKSQGVFGEELGGLWRSSKGLFYLDKTGLRRLVPGADDHSVSDTLIASDVCRVGVWDNAWATFFSPCAAQDLKVYGDASDKLYDLTSSADPRFLRLVPARGSAGRDPVLDPFWYLFLRAVDPATGLGELVVKTPTGDERVLGVNAALDRAEVNESTTPAYGYAFVNMRGVVGSYIHWNDKGETRELAQDVYIRSRRLLVDFDGTIGKAAAVSGDRLAILAERVPYQAFEYPDANKQWTVVFHDWYGDSGKLSAFAGTFESLTGTPLDAPFTSPKLELIAPSAAVFRTAPLGDVLPGAIYLADFDAEPSTGRLEYRNTELRFSAVIDQGVSDYLVTRDEVIYAIPFGERAGIWLTGGK